MHPTLSASALPKQKDPKKTIVLATVNTICIPKGCKNSAQQIVRLSNAICWEAGLCVSKYGLDMQRGLAGRGWEQNLGMDKTNLAQGWENKLLL